MEKDGMEKEKNIKMMENKYMKVDIIMENGMVKEKNIIIKVN